MIQAASWTTTVEVTGQTDLEDDVRVYGRAKSGLVERQFMLPLVQTAEGLPITHEVMLLPKNVLHS